MIPSAIHWTDPRTWPWIIFVWLAFALFGFAKPVWRWLHHKRAKTWAATQGIVQTTETSDNKHFLRITYTSLPVASFKYTYNVGGAVYSGTYKKEFGTYEECDDFLQNLEGKSVTIQYDPEHPSRSFILDDSITALLSLRPASVASPLEIRRYSNPLPSSLVRVLPLFSALALVGFVLSVVVNVGAITSRWTAPNYVLVLHVGIFLVFAPAIFVAQKRMGRANRKDFWKIALQGTPDWMRYFLYVVVAYPFAIGFPSWIRAVQQPHGPPLASGTEDWFGFSATWMVFYWASFAILYAAIQQERLAPRCVNGHLALPGAQFCAQCGQPVVQT